MRACDDCGTRMEGDICPNCHEELHILVHQQDDMDELTPAFAEKARNQQADILRKQRGKRGGEG